MKDNNKIFRLTQDAEGPVGIKLVRGQEIQIVREMVYMGGFPLQESYQKPMLNWVSNNKHVLTDIT